MIQRYPVKSAQCVDRATRKETTLSFLLSKKKKKKKKGVPCDREERGAEHRSRVKADIRLIAAFLIMTLMSDGYRVSGVEPIKGKSDVGRPKWKRTEYRYRSRPRVPFLPSPQHFGALSEECTRARSASEEEGLTSRGRCPNELFPRISIAASNASYDTERRDAFHRLPGTG